MSQATDPTAPVPAGCRVCACIPDATVPGGLLVVDVTGTSAVERWPPRREDVLAVAAAIPTRVSYPDGVRHDADGEAEQLLLDEQRFDVDAGGGPIGC